MQIFAVPAFQDNYLWVLANPHTAQAAVVDPGDASPVLAFLAEHQLKLSAILITHHHADHIGGVDALLKAFPGIPVYGPDTPRIPEVDRPVAENSTITVLDTTFTVMEVPGHTLEHVAYVSIPEDDQPPALFCGDTLFAGGCGRMFEGNPPMMQHSLQKLAALSPATAVYCAHEYTLGNLRFAQAVMPDNAALAERVRSDTATRAAGKPTVPSSIGLELATNPFMRCSEPDVIAMARQNGAGQDTDPASVFGALRRWKDNF